MRSRPFATVVVLASLLAAGAASASPFQLAVDPSESWLEILPGSGLQLNLPTPPGTVFAPFEAQAGAGGQGLHTALGGTIRVALAPSSTLQFLAVNTAVEVLPSGSFTPGAPGSPAMPEPAGFAFELGANGLGLEGSFALRELFFSVAGAPRYDEVAPGVLEFPSFLPSFAWEVIHGLLDADPDFGLGSGRSVLDEIAFTVILGPDHLGHLELFGDEDAQLTLPIVGSFVIPGSALGSSLPFAILLEVQGQLVARTAGFPVVPEPGAALLVALGTAALVALIGGRFRG